MERNSDFHPGVQHPQARPAKSKCVAFCQALEGYSELPSPGCWALWLPGTQGHLRKQVKREVWKDAQSPAGFG